MLGLELSGDHWRGVPVMEMHKGSNAWFGNFSVGIWREYSERCFWAGVFGGEFPLWSSGKGRSTGGSRGPHRK